MGTNLLTPVKAVLVGDHKSVLREKTEKLVRVIKSSVNSYLYYIHTELWKSSRIHLKLRNLFILRLNPNVNGMLYVNTRQVPLTQLFTLHVSATSKVADTQHLVYLRPHVYKHVACDR